MFTLFLKLDFLANIIRPPK